MKYGYLLYPHHNDRYNASLKLLSSKELMVMAYGMQVEISHVGYEAVRGVELLCFEAEGLTETHLKRLLQLSSGHILFELAENGYLRPAAEREVPYVPEDISGILKYKGKTNEMFTDMMLNLAIYAGDFTANMDKPLRILDPMCGRGTTLYKCLMRGYNAAGIEMNKQDITEATAYLKRYFEYHKIKHNTADSMAADQTHKYGKKHFFEMASTFDAYKNKDRRTLELCGGNCEDAAGFFAKNSFHAIVCDLPYGVQHSARGKKGYSGVDALVAGSLSGWLKVLKPGGTVVLAFNANTTKRELLADILNADQFHVLDEPPYDTFEHWVEQAVSREVIVAKKMK